MSYTSVNDERVICKKCKMLTVATFKYCQNCVVENSVVILSAPLPRKCTYFTLHKMEISIEFTPLKRHMIPDYANFDSRPCKF